MVGVRELKNQATQILRAVAERGTSVVVTKHGRPTALILPIDSPEAEDYVLSHAPEIVASLRDAESDFKQKKTITLDEYGQTRNG